MKEIRRANREAMKHIKETVEKKHHKQEEGVDTAKKEREHEIMMKREVRILKEEDFKKVHERHKRKDQLKKMYIIERELEGIEQVERIKSERERLAKENAERHRLQAVERSQLENAVAKLVHIQTSKGREKYLKDHHFDQAFIQKIRAKLPMLLDDNFGKKKEGTESKN